MIDRKMLEVVRNSYEAIKEAKTFKEFDDITLNVKKNKCKISGRTEVDIFQLDR